MARKQLDTFGVLSGTSQAPNSSRAEPLEAELAKAVRTKRNLDTARALGVLSGEPASTTGIPPMNSAGELVQVMQGAANVATETGKLALQREAAAREEAKDARDTADAKAAQAVEAARSQHSETLQIILAHQQQQSETLRALADVKGEVAAAQFQVQLAQLQGQLEKAEQQYEFQMHLAQQEVERANQQLQAAQAKVQQLEAELDNGIERQAGRAIVSGQLNHPALRAFLPQSGPDPESEWRHGQVQIGLARAQKQLEAEDRAEDRKDLTAQEVRGLITEARGLLGGLRGVIGRYASGGTAPGAPETWDAVGGEAE